MSDRPGGNCEALARSVRDRLLNIARRPGAQVTFNVARVPLVVLPWPARPVARAATAEPVVQ